jgi:hypothetical protein
MFGTGHIVEYSDFLRIIVENILLLRYNGQVYSIAVITAEEEQVNINVSNNRDVSIITVAVVQNHKSVR